MHHTPVSSRLRLLFLAVAVALVALVGCNQAGTLTAEPAEPTPPTEKVVVSLPSPTPTQSTATFTAEPTAIPTSTPLPPTNTPTRMTTRTRTPTATRTTAPSPQPTTTATAAATAIPKPTAAPAAPPPPSGSVNYQPEFPPVSPASEPPAFDDHTNPLSGQHVDDAGRVRRRAVLVRYGNDPQARPHAGIAQAELVMEDLMEAYWITRLTAVFLENTPEQVGPLRSARPVNIEMLPAFDGMLVYSGASIGVTQLLAQNHFDLIDERNQNGLFYRSSQKSSPHNLYTNLVAVRERLRAVGWERPSNIRGFTFSDTPPAGQPANRVDIPLPSSSVVAWTWDGPAGVYRRWVQGKPYTDALTGEQVGCANVIVIYAKHWKTDIVEDSLGSRAIGIALKGGERVQIFRDGQVIEGYWWRKDANQLFQFIDQAGNPIPLKPGHSWMQFVPTTYQLGIQ